MKEQVDFATFCKAFDTDEKCAEALFLARWPEGFRCPECASRHCYLIRTRRLPLYECTSCRRQTSVTAGTVMEGSRTPLPKWFQAVFLLSRQDGISSVRLAEILKVTYKTAWHISHKIRHAMLHADQKEPLSGLVRIDRMDYGSVLFKEAKHPVMVGASFDQTGQPVQFKMKQPDPGDVRNETRTILRSGMEAFVKEHASPDAQVLCRRDGGIAHPVLRQARGNMNRWLNRTFQGIGAKHLQSYLDEFCYRLNRDLQQKDVFPELLRWCASSPALIYRDLIRSRPTLPVPWLVFGSKAKWKGRLLSLWNECG